MLTDRLQHPLPVYQGCTLQQVLWVMSVSTLGLLLVCPLMSLLFLERGVLGTVIALLLSPPVTRLNLVLLGRLIAHHPPGYLKRRFWGEWAPCLGLCSPILTRQGPWRLGETE